MSIRISDRLRRVFALLIPALWMGFNLPCASASDPDQLKAAKDSVVAAKYEIKGKHRPAVRFSSAEGLSRPVSYALSRNSGTAWQAASSGLPPYAVSLDGGTTWQAANSGLPPQGYLQGTDSPKFDPSNPDVQYICVSGSDSGEGVYKTSDGGQNWNRLSNGLPSPDSNPPPHSGQLGFWGANSIAISPQDASTIYVGIGGMAPALRGLYRSTDGGESFTHISTVPDGSFITIDPQTPSTIYGASISGEFIRSGDSGATWSVMDNGLPSTIGGGNGSINSIAVDPDSKLYVGVYLARGAKGTGIYKSTDKGRHWSPVETDIGVHEIVIDPLHPSIIYGVDQLGQPADDQAASDQGHGNPRRRTAQSLPLEGVIKSVDGGQTWASVNGGLPGFAGAVYQLAIDPLDSDILYLGTSTKIWKSSDGGQSWNSFGSGLFPMDEFTLAVDPKTKGKVYASLIDVGTGPQIQGASISGKELIVTGQNFAQGTQIMLNGKVIATLENPQNPGGSVYSMKGAKKIHPGTTVELRVMDSDFTESNTYTFTRPSN